MEEEEVSLFYTMEEEEVSLFYTIEEDEEEPQQWQQSPVHGLVYSNAV